MKTELPEEDLKQIADSLVSGNKIGAIKVYREATGLGLKEAIEEITASLSSEYPDLKKKNSSGCALIIVLAISMTLWLLSITYGRDIVPSYFKTGFFVFGIMILLSVIFTKSKIR